MSINGLTIKLTETPDTILKRMNKKGHKVVISGDPVPSTLAESHVQGVARWSNQLFLTHNNKGHANGWLLVAKLLDGSKGDLRKKLNTPDEGLNHPGGIQIIGDLLALPVEHATKAESRVHLCSFTEDSYEVLTTVTRTSAKAGGVGITNFTDVGQSPPRERYLMAVIDNGKLDVYLSDGVIDATHPSCTFELNNSGLTIDKPNISGVCLVTARPPNASFDRAYLLAFASKGIPTEAMPTSYEDLVSLWEFEFQQKVTVHHVADYHFVAPHSDIRGLDDIHFRWGGGARVVNSGALELWATQRNFTSISGGAFANMSAAQFGG